MLESFLGEETVSHTDRLLRRLRRAIERQGVRGLDADGIALDALVQRTLRSEGWEPAENSTGVGIRWACLAFLRAERRRRTRELAQVHNHTPKRPDSLEERESLDALAHVLEDATVMEDVVERFALAWHSQGVPLHLLGQVLGGSRSAWSRRLLGLRERLRQKMTHVGLDGTVLRIPGADTILGNTLSAWADLRQKRDAGRGPARDS
jgi:hypothetical protein